ncbi:MAG: hypothetical protein SGARI_007317 [Bacillariaceae sp.]
MVNISPRQGEPAAFVGKRALCKGEELLMDYGPKPASRFVQAYGICPNVFWEQNELAIDCLVIDIRNLIDPDDWVRHRVCQFEYCNCEPFRNEYFLFAPEDLRKWKNESEFPWCLRDLIVYLHIKAAPIEKLRRATFHCPFLGNIMRQSMSGKLTRNIRAQLVKILDNNERRLSKPRESMKDQSGYVSSKRQTAAALNQFALNAVAEWRRMIIAAPIDDDDSSLALNGTSVTCLIL